MHVIPEFKGDHFFLSNFFEAPTVYYIDGDKVTMPTGEHAFQAAKMHAMVDTDQVHRKDYVLKMANAPTPSRAKYLGRSVDIHQDIWEDVRVECMREVVFQKFAQHLDLRQQLLKTKDAMLVEGNDWGDKFWGRVDGKGYNKLGVILMEIRGVWLWSSRHKNMEMGS